MSEPKSDLAGMRGSLRTSGSALLARAFRTEAETPTTVGDIQTRGLSIDHTRRPAARFQGRGGRSQAGGLGASADSTRGAINTFAPSPDHAAAYAALGGVPAALVIGCRERPLPFAGHLISPVAARCPVVRGAGRSVCRARRAAVLPIFPRRDVPRAPRGRARRSGTHRDGRVGARRGDRRLAARR